MTEIKYDKATSAAIFTTLEEMLDLQGQDARSILNQFEGQTIAEADKKMYNNARTALNEIERVKKLLSSVVINVGGKKIY